MLGRVLTAGACVALFSGCGSSSSSNKSSSSSSNKSSSSSSGATTVTLSLSGGTGNLNSVACHKQEAFERYGFPAQVTYTGNVAPAPAGRWKVKLKLKLCNGSSYVDEDSQKIVGQPSGRFDGVLVVPKRGAYSLRAQLEGANKPQSQKVYLQAG